MKRFFKDKKGSSLVFVLIAMTFMTILALAIISLTVTNIRLKASQKKTQENFYHTDSVLDDIKAGIQNESSKISAQAYSQSLSGYNSALAGAGTTLNDQYANRFLNDMVTTLTGGPIVAGTTTYYYKDSVLKSYIEGKDEDVNKVYVNHTVPGGGTETCGTLEVDGESLILKDVQVLKEENSYKTTIKTDIRIDVPKVSSEAHCEYMDYAIIADNQIKGNTLTGGGSTINGNVYAGTVNRDDSTYTTGTTGIYVTGSSGLLNINAKNIISRGDILVDNGNKLNVNGTDGSACNIWVENILTGGSTANTININANTNVADDLEANGSGDKISLSGKYYGYNYNDDYTDETKLATKAGYSSAISINGQSENVNLSNLDILILAGRTFISKKVTNPGDFTDNPDIKLGESMAVKSSQLAYYVPGQFINQVVAGSSLGYATNADGKDVYNFQVPGDTQIYSFDYDGYNKYVDIPDYEDAGTTKTFNVMDYLDINHPLHRYMRKDSSITESDAVLIYFYLNFDSNDKASQFYDKFYSGSGQEAILDPTNKNYVGADGLRLKGADAILCSSGNIMYSDTSTGDLKLKLGNDSATADSALAIYAKNKSKEYLSRQLALIGDYSDAMSNSLWRLSDNKDDNLSKSGLKDGTNLFNKMIDSTKLTNNGLVKLDDDNYLYTSNEENKTFTWDTTASNSLGADKACIIVTKGNVDIKANFRGLIIAGGDVTISATGITVNSAEETVDAMFGYDKALDSPKFYNMFSQYFRKSVDASLGNGGSTDADNISFENWSKNK